VILVVLLIDLVKSVDSSLCSRTKVGATVPLTSKTGGYVYPSYHSQNYAYACSSQSSTYCRRIATVKLLLVLYVTYLLLIGMRPSQHR
jgi:hypothetical protein